jgi:probable phosphoglycerate mutase
LRHEPWPDDIETLDALQRRARAFLDFIRTTFHGQQVLAVGHGIINKAIQAVYHHKPMNQVERMMNCEVRTLQL